jgi:hypothetical protein
MFLIASRVVLRIVFWGVFALVWLMGLTNEQFVPNCTGLRANSEQSFP